MVRSGLGGAGRPGSSARCFLGALVIAHLEPVRHDLRRADPRGVRGAAVSARRCPAPAPSARKAGRDLWSRAGGFKRILSTPSAQDRFDFSGRQELYTAYIPWAVAFGCADEWAEKYRTEMGGDPPVPSYFGSAYAGAYVGSAVSSMVSDFNSTVSSAISSYEATQTSSSSGGGGGFSGGGGGGGGGGGSW